MKKKIKVLADSRDLVLHDLKWLLLKTVNTEAY